MNIDLIKKTKDDLEKYSFNLMNNAGFGKKHAKCERTGILNWPQQKEEGIVQYQNQITILQGFAKKIYQQQK